jgi:hypothetical protein
MADDIKIELRGIYHGPQSAWWVDMHMTNKKGTEYGAEVSVGGVVRYVHNITKDRHYYRITDAPKWVKKTIEEQLPIVAIMLS